MLYILTLVAALQAQPLLPKFKGDIHLMNRGTTQLIMNDWRTENRAQSLPDRSFKSIWVRMFPLLNVPLGDPYPVTVNLDQVYLYNSQGLAIFDLTGRAIGVGRSVQFDFNSAEIFIDGASLKLDSVWVSPQGTVTTTAKWDNNNVRIELRGSFIVKKSLHEPKDVAPRELWSVTNVLSINDYLLSVVPSEVLASWHSETLRAQAIAARTYAVFEMAEARAAGRDFDVDPTTWYQSYQGSKFWQAASNSYKAVELSSTNNAVKNTGNKVILHSGEVIKALFSSNSGGRTCLLSECLELPYDLPYLKAVDDAPGIQNAPGGTWGARATLTAALIKEKLKSYGFEFNGQVKRLEHLERGPSGRTWRLRMILTDGSHMDLDRFHTRKIMHLFGPIRSFQYELGAMTGGKQSIIGHGYGHGVGMSQWGAQLFAKHGWTAEQILNHFYYNVSIQDLAP